MRNLDCWVQRLPCSAPAAMKSNPTDRRTTTQRPRGLRAPEQYRTLELIEEVRKNRVLWHRDARGFNSAAARRDAHKRVANAMNRRFPGLRPWHEREVEIHWYLLVSYRFACLREHCAGGKPHSITCRMEQVSFLDDGLRACADLDMFIPRL